MPAERIKDGGLSSRNFGVGFLRATLFLRLIGAGEKSGNEKRL